MGTTALTLLLITAAGAATVLGGVAAFGFGGKGGSLVPAGLSFAAGALFFTAVIEVLPESVAALSEDLGKGAGATASAGAALAGFLLILAIERAVPHDHSSHGRPGAFVALAVAAHNFPEGMAALLISLNSPETGVPVIIAVAAHNIPLGMAISMPFCQAQARRSGGRRKAVLWSLAAGMAGPLGALAGLALLGGLPAGGRAFALLSPATAGVMLYVAMMELLPDARRGSSATASALGFCAGAAAMGGLSMLLG